MDKDPVCGILVDPNEAAETRMHEGRIYHFCSRGCAGKFDEAPGRYVGDPAPPPRQDDNPPQ
jgi:P-type Cu+ transporter